MNARAEPAVGLVEQTMDRALSGVKVSIAPQILALLTCLTSAVAAAALAVEWPLLGVPLGLLALILAALTGVALRRDGVTAGTRALGVLLLVVAESALLVGAALYARGLDRDGHPFAIAVLALAGTVVLTYARMRILASAGFHLADGPSGIASREARFTLLLLASALSLPYIGLLLVAAVTHLSVCAHLFTLRTRLQD